MPHGLGVRVPPCAINLKPERRLGFFNLEQGAGKLLCMRGDEKGGAMFLFEPMIDPYGERQKPRARPAGVWGQPNDRKARRKKE